MEQALFIWLIGLVVSTGVHTAYHQVKAVEKDRVKRQVVIKNEDPKCSKWIH